jgi:carboxypeptidase Q
MRRMMGVVRVKMLLLLCAAVLALPAATQQQNEPLDLDAIYKIKQEGLQRSQVMDIMSWLTDVHGPRLTGSPNIKAAADWAVKKLTEWGVSNPRLEPWGPFGRGWSNQRFYAHVISPQQYPLIGYPVAWTPGTDGMVTGEAVLAVIADDADFDKFRGKLRGKFVLTAAMRDVNPLWEAPARRYTDEQLADISRQPIPGARPPQFGPGGPGGGGQQALRRRMQYFVDEGVLALLEPGRGDGGTVFVGGAPRDPGIPTPPRVVLAIEHYGRIVRTLEKNLPVTIEMNIQNRFHEEDPNAFNVIAEIPGTDKAGELVMLGAHFDSWHSGTGATDNAAGSAVMLEVMRILKATGLKMRRTVRLGLWSGEEQGLLGSRAYVQENFGDRTTMQLKPAHAKFSGYFNIDNGTGRIRGVYLQGNEAIAPVFERWMEPFRNMGMTTLSIRNTGGTDHLSFDAVGLPGFQFIQDPMEYSSRTHHSNMDVYERIQAEDMKQIAAIVASFVYHAANRDALLPRKPLPAPQRAAGPPQPQQQEPPRGPGKAPQRP